MKYETVFNFGDKGWTEVSGFVHQVTIGQIRIEHTKSIGKAGSPFSNFQAKTAYKESYMCEETGIDCGTVYMLGENIFLTSDECTEANAERVSKFAKEKAAFDAENLDRLLMRQIELSAEIAVLKKTILEAT